MPNGKLSSQEQAVANQFALQLEAMGLPSDQAQANASNLVAEVLSDLRPHGIDLFKLTQGNDYALRDNFVAPRRAAGLTVEDIKAHWNRPLLVIFCEVKFRELVNFVFVDMARQRGTDVAAAGLEYKRTFPRYGDPTRWNPSEKFNLGLRPIDADVYPEFAGRVDAWRAKTPSEEVSRLIGEHGTLNAVIRHLVAAGAL